MRSANGDVVIRSGCVPFGIVNSKSTPSVDQQIRMVSISESDRQMAGESVDILTAADSNTYTDGDQADFEIEFQKSVEGQTYVTDKGKRKIESLSRAGQDVGLITNSTATDATIAVVTRSQSCQAKYDGAVGEKGAAMRLEDSSHKTWAPRQAMAALIKRAERDLDRLEMNSKVEKFEPAGRTCDQSI